MAASCRQIPKIRSNEAARRKGIGGVSTVDDGWTTVLPPAKPIASSGICFEAVSLLVLLAFRAEEQAPEENSILERAAVDPANGLEISVFEKCEHQRAEASSPAFSRCG